MTVARLLAIALTLAAGAAAGQDGQPTPTGAAVSSEAALTPEPPPSLDDLLWISRPLVIFADNPNDPRFVQQMAMLEADPGPLVERQVVVLTDTVPAEDGPLRQRLRPLGFGLVLIDTDGSVAHRRPAPTTVRELSNFIDRMPSRRQETGSRRQ